MIDWLDFPTKGNNLYLLTGILLSIALIEAGLYARARRQAFDWKSSLSSIALAVGHKGESTLTAFIAISQFRWATEHRIADIPVNTWWGMLSLFLAAEFFYYWQHRLSHEIRWFWATHRVHHSVEQLTVTANYRHGLTGTISGMAFLYLPLALMGFPPVPAIKMLGLIILYQYWVHTELIGRMGWLDGILNTPSNHRVHHARNLEYLDRNYGGVTVLFDRLFGTYVRERDDIKIEYGLLGHKATNNPLALAFDEWKYIIRDLRGAKTWRDRIGYLVGKPGWKPMPLPAQEPEPEPKKAA